MECCVCGKKINEDNEEVIIDMPFAGQSLSFCSKKCMDEACG